MRRWLPPALLPGLLLAAGLPAAAQRPGKVNPETAAVVRGDTAFALDLYRQLAKADGNLFLSPYSISTALGMTYAGARGDTAEQMARTLHFPFGQDRLHPAYHGLIREVNGAGRPRKYQLQTANRLWGQKGYGFLPDFLKVVEANYGAGLKEVDFAGATEQARKAINAWVEGQTRDKIKDLLKPGILDADTRLVLTNAIYFKSAWNFPFRERATVKGDFHVTPEKKVTVPLMRGGYRTTYAKGKGFEVLQLPYENGDLSMVIFLPSKAGGLSAFEKRLTAENLETWTGEMSVHQVDVTLPRFKITAEFQLNDVLARLGMPDAFDPKKADFSGMTTRDKLFLSHVVHKAFVDVNEKGTEAAAATAVVAKGGGGRGFPRATFRADRPFVFLIREHRTGSILFLGRVVNPS
jgi:serine protease inhibitor